MSFGRTMLEHFPLEPQAVYLNHGTVVNSHSDPASAGTQGVTPWRVLEAQQAIRNEIERHPARFLLRELSGLTASSKLAQPRLRSAAQEVAHEYRHRRAAGAASLFLGARGEDLVFVGNATTGVNAVLRSLGLEPGRRGSPQGRPALRGPYRATRHGYRWAAVGANFSPDLQRPLRHRAVCSGARAEALRPVLTAGAGVSQSSHTLSR
ncbi:hypothetical protein [Allomeiothermus silvanus]|uniref:hypothetical protein n=1 Tax=Allomeiothermus silvanus TaxID=52022 RepID=UPI0015759A7C|nr:hypothetical protein [Allomeiothermus silvanus]